MRYACASKRDVVCAAHWRYCTWALAAGRLVLDTAGLARSKPCATTCTQSIKQAQCLSSKTSKKQAANPSSAFVQMLFCQVKSLGWRAARRAACTLKSPAATVSMAMNAAVRIARQIGTAARNMPCRTVELPEQGTPTSTRRLWPLSTDPLGLPRPPLHVAASGVGMRKLVGAVDELV
jgi:hypothetical protein